MYITESTLIYSIVEWPNITKNITKNTINIFKKLHFIMSQRKYSYLALPLPSQNRRTAL